MIVFVDGRKVENSSDLNAQRRGAEKVPLRVANDDTLQGVLRGRVVYVCCNGLCASSISRGYFARGKSSTDELAMNILCRPERTVSIRQR